MAATSVVRRAGRSSVSVRKDAGYFLLCLVFPFGAEVLRYPSQLGLGVGRYRGREFQFCDVRCWGQPRWLSSVAVLDISCPQS